MEAQWHLIQYTADMRRKEPRNVGVVVGVEGTWRVKLFAVDETNDFAVDARSLRRIDASKDSYEAWVDYYSRMLLAGRVEEVLDFQRKRPTEYRLVSGGYMESGVGTPDDIAGRLFRELVFAPGEVAENHAAKLRNRVEKVLTVAQIQPQVDVLVPARWGGRGSQLEPDDDVKFDYAFTNGQRHLMDRLQLHQTNTEQSKMISRDFNARVSGALASGAARSFVAFYSGEVIDEIGGDAVLTPARKVARIIDVDRTADAAEELVSLIA